MQITCITYRPERHEGPEAGVLYQIVERVFGTLPPLSTLVEYHRDTSLYEKWVVIHQKVMNQGSNRGMSSSYDYDLYPLAPSDYFEVRLHVRGCPRYNEWQPEKRPTDWEILMKQEQPYCSYVSVKTHGWADSQTIRYQRRPLTDPRMSSILEQVLNAGLLVRIHGSPDNISLASSLTLQPGDIRKQLLPNGLTHWLCFIQEQELKEEEKHEHLF